MYPMMAHAAGKARMEELLNEAEARRQVKQANAQSPNQPGLSEQVAGKMAEAAEAVASASQKVQDQPAAS